MQEKEQKLTELQCKNQKEFWKKIGKIGIGNERQKQIQMEIVNEDGTMSFDKA